MSMFDLMAAPFAECMVLVAIHTYLGIHVLRRRVIFVDLALAQTAALGSTVGFLFGILPDTVAALIFSMTFTFLAAAIFALTRIRDDRVPQEAVIGLFYAIAAAAAVLVVQKTQGAEHLEGILVGSLLWVKWADVATAAAAYAVIGVIHFVFRRQFLLISESPDKAYQQGMSVRAWDFLFYLTFGFVIAFSVRVAGVLLVFVFLVAPAIMAFMITSRLKLQLLIGWTMGTVVTVIGLYLSYAADLPSGPAVVTLYGVVLAVGAVVYYLIRAENKALAFKWFGLGLGVMALVVSGVYWEGKLLGASSLAEGGRHHHHGPVEGDDHHRELDEQAERQEEAEARAILAPRIAKMKTDVGDAVPEARLGEYLSLEDADSRLEFVRAACARDSKEGLAFLVCYLADEETPLFFRTEALELLKQNAGEDFGYVCESDPAGNERALAAMRRRLVEEEAKKVAAPADEAVD